MRGKESVKNALKRTQGELADANDVVEREKTRGAQYKRQYGEAVSELEKPTG